MLAVGFAATWVFGGGDGDIARTGELAPDFAVELIDGGEFDLADHFEDDNRPLVLNLWASWCPPCREEIPDLSAFALANPEIAVLGVAVEDRVEDARSLAAELEPSYPLGLGTDDFEDAYPNLGLPVTYFIDDEGTVTEVFNGVLTMERLEELTTR